MLLVVLVLSLACARSREPCEIVAAEWEEELARVQACEVDEDCGYPIPGTSCGCTRNLVAANEASIDQLLYIKQVGDDVGCALVPQTACDCPDADGFVCDDGRCAWSYIQDP